MTAVMRMLMIVVSVFGDKDDYERCYDDTDVNGSRYDDVN
jgi:hypothetical protein